MRAVCVLMMVLMVLGCAAGPSRDLVAPDLDADIHRFGQAQAVAVEDFMALDDEMRRFVRDATEGARSRESRLQRLMQSLFRPGEYTITYAGDHTYTARQTFHRGSGNCLSTTALLVAMAREAGLTASFQVMEAQPTPRIDDRLWIHERHVRAIVETGRGGRTLIDFDRRTKKSPSNDQVEDSVAAAEFFNNLAVGAMQRGELDLAHANFRQAVALQPGLSYVWNNIGVLYKRAGLLGGAEQALLHAIALSSDEIRAMSNLSALYQQTGRPEAAQAYASELERARRRNPYYLYALAMRAYEDKDYEQSMAYLRRAMRLKKSEPAFSELLREVQSRQQSPSG